MAQGLLGNTFLMCSIASFALGIYSFTLPRTPPLPKPEQQARLRDFLGLDALGLLRHKNFVVFFVSSILICIPLAFYYQNANQFSNRESGRQRYRQADHRSDVGSGVHVFDPGIPQDLRDENHPAAGHARLGLAGIYCLLLAIAHELGFMLLIGIALHGACYRLLFCLQARFTTDSKAGAQHKPPPQGLITLATYGVGMLVGFWAGRPH